MRQVGQGFGWLLVKYPHGTTHGLALSIVGAACAYFIHAAIQSGLAQTDSRRRK